MNASGRLDKTVIGVLVVVLALAGQLTAQGTSAVAKSAGTLASTAPTEPGTFQIHVQGADIRDVLRMLSEQSQRNIVATKEVTGEVSADLYDVTFKEALNAVLRSHGFGYMEKGTVIYVYTGPQLQAALQAEREMGRRLYRLAYVPAADAKALIIPVLTADGTISISPAANAGIAKSDSETGGSDYASDDVLIVVDYEDNLKNIDKLIRELDIRPQQVQIEATILRAKLTEDNDMGIDFNLLAGVDFSNLVTTTDGLTKLTVPTGTAVSALESARAGTFRTDFNTAVGSGGLSIGFLSNNAAFFIRALEGITDFSVLANPKLLVINKQRGEVIVGNKDGYLTTTVTDTVATQTVEFLETGTRLIVRPYIGRNGYIRMEIHPEDSSGSVSLVGTSVLPSETTTEVTTNVLVRDGRTIVIGGLFREETQSSRSQVPLLGDLPYAGVLFRNTLDDTRREEVIILITPRIIKHAQDEAVGEQYKDDIERFRVGMRKGLRWWGRNRMAQGHMRKAKQSLREGDTAQAVWDVDMALSMHPHMHQAIKLKERLTDQAYWADESRNSAIRFLIQRMIMQELGKPAESILPPNKPLDSRQLDPEVRKALGIESAARPSGAEVDMPEELIKSPRQSADLE